MSDSMSLLLVNMVTAVEQGFSYDGIVSVPETGLEDAGQRPGLVGHVERIGNALRKAKRQMRKWILGEHSPPVNLSPILARTGNPQDSRSEEVQPGDAVHGHSEEGEETTQP